MVLWKSAPEEEEENDDHDQDALKKDFFMIFFEGLRVRWGGPWP